MGMMGYWDCVNFDRTNPFHRMGGPFKTVYTYRATISYIRVLKQVSWVMPGKGDYNVRRVYSLHVVTTHSLCNYKAS